MSGYVLGVDPSTVASGFSVLNLDGGLVDYGVIKPDKDTLTIEEQAAYQYNLLNAIMDKHDIRYIACEDQHQGPNADTFKQLSRVSGYVILLAGIREVPIRIYQPAKWRKITHGKGSVDKKHTRLWVNETHGTEFKTKHNDITDSIGIGTALVIELKNEREEMAI